MYVPDPHNQSGLVSYICKTKSGVNIQRKSEKNYEPYFLDVIKSYVIRLSN